METLRDIAPLVALVAAALAVALLVVLIVLAVRMQRLRQAQLAVLGQHGQRDLVAHAEELDVQVRTLREAVERLTLDLSAQRTRLDDTLTHRALVRYDAFRDAGGEQSASLALLDDHRSGFVLSTIAARDFARVYVKYLHAGVPDKDLSPEEREAVTVAVPEPLPERRPKAGGRSPVPGDEEPAAAEGDASPRV